MESLYVKAPNNLQSLDDSRKQLELCIACCAQLARSSSFEFEELKKRVIPIFSSLIFNSNDGLVVNTYEFLPTFCEFLIKNMNNRYFKDDRIIERTSNQRGGEENQFIEEAINKQTYSFVADNIVPMIMSTIESQNTFRVKSALMAYSSIFSLFSNYFFEMERSNIEKIVNSTRVEVQHSISAFLLNISDKNIFEFAKSFIENTIGDTRPALKQDALGLIAQYSSKINIFASKINNQYDSDKILKKLGQYYLELARCKASVVRRAAVMHLATFLISISEVNHKFKSIIGRPILDELLKDNTMIVKKMIISKSGQLLYCFGKESPALLIEMYKLSFTSKSELYNSVFNFPSVVLSLGSFDLFKDTFMTAIKSNDVKVRRSLAFGLGEYAYLIVKCRLLRSRPSNSLTSSTSNSPVLMSSLLNPLTSSLSSSIESINSPNLIPKSSSSLPLHSDAFAAENFEEEEEEEENIIINVDEVKKNQEFLREVIEIFLNDLPTVSIGIISSIEKLAPLLDEPDSVFLPAMKPTKYAGREWRHRLAIAQQIRACAHLFQSRTTILFDYVVSMINDDVAAVRKEACITLAATLLDNGNACDFLKKVIAKSDSFLERWAAATVYLYAPEIARKHTEVLKELCDDTTETVRIAARRAAKAVGL